MTPDAHAQTLLAWASTRTEAAIVAALADPLHPTFAAIDAIAQACLAGAEAERSAGLSALFGTLIEGLNDRLDRAGRAASARWFARAVWRAAEHDATLAMALGEFAITDEISLVTRHQRLRSGSDPWPENPQRIAILSRVTVGADIQITSVAIQRLRQRFPKAHITVVGDPKLAGLFAFTQVSVTPVSYQRRGDLATRLRSWLTVRAAVANCDLVISPDSRLDQLGLLPLHHDPSRHRLWENCLTDGSAPLPLAIAMDRWCSANLGIGTALPAIALAPLYRDLRQRLHSGFGTTRRWCAVKLDHGGNSAKALPRSAEILWLRALCAAGWGIVLDRGFGPAELSASDALCTDAGIEPYDLDEEGKIGHPLSAIEPAQLAGYPVIRIHGSIAAWAATVAASQRALSYDSVGQHLAAAAGVEVIVPFTGYANRAFITAWTPVGSAAVTVIPIAPSERDDPALHQKISALVVK